MMDSQEKKDLPKDERAGWGRYWGTWGQPETWVNGVCSIIGLGLLGAGSVLLSGVSPTFTTLFNVTVFGYGIYTSLREFSKLSRKAKQLRLLEKHPSRELIKPEKPLSFVQLAKELSWSQFKNLFYSKGNTPGIIGIVTTGTSLIIYIGVAFGEGGNSTGAQVFAGLTPTLGPLLIYFNLEKLQFDIGQLERRLDSLLEEQQRNEKRHLKALSELYPILTYILNQLEVVRHLEPEPHHDFSVDDSLTDSIEPYQRRWDYRKRLQSEIQLFDGVIKTDEFWYLEKFDKESKAIQEALEIIEIQKEKLRKFAKIIDVKESLGSKREIPFEHPSKQNEEASLLFGISSGKDEKNPKQSFENKVQCAYEKLKKDREQLVIEQESVIQQASTLYETLAEECRQQINETKTTLREMLEVAEKLKQSQLLSEASEGEELEELLRQQGFKLEKIEESLPSILSTKIFKIDLKDLPKTIQQLQMIIQDYEQLKQLQATVVKLKQTHRELPRELIDSTENMSQSSLSNFLNN